MQYIYLLYKKTFLCQNLKREKIVTVSINTVDITDLDVKVWTQKSELPQGNSRRYLTQPKSRRQITFKLIYIEYG